MSPPSFPRHEVYFRSVVVGNLAPRHTQASRLSGHADGRKCLLRDRTCRFFESRLRTTPSLNFDFFHRCDETAIRMRYIRSRLFLDIRGENVCSSRYTKWYLTPTKYSSTVQRFVSRHIYVKYEMPRDHRHSYPLQNPRNNLEWNFPNGNLI